MRKFIRTNFESGLNILFWLTVAGFAITGLGAGVTSGNPLLGIVGVIFGTTVGLILSIFSFGTIYVLLDIERNTAQTAQELAHRRQQNP